MISCGTGPHFSGVASDFESSAPPRSAGGQRREALDQRLGMHRLPHGEVALKLNVLVRNRERLWSCCGVDDPVVDDLDEALATSQVVSEGGGRGRCVGSYSHFAALWFRSGRNPREQSPPPGPRSRRLVRLASEAPPHRAPVTLCLKHRLTQRLIRPSSAVDCGASLLPHLGRARSRPKHCAALAVTGVLYRIKKSV
jgi:hypothetical protein